jgi:hypothetical protein
VIKVQKGKKLTKRKEACVEEKGEHASVRPKQDSCKTVGEDELQ